MFKTLDLITPLELDEGLKCRSEVNDVGGEETVEDHNNQEVPHILKGGVLSVRQQHWNLGFCFIYFLNKTHSLVTNLMIEGT